MSIDSYLGVGVALLDSSFYSILYALCHYKSLSLVWICFMVHYTINLSRKTFQTVSVAIELKRITVSKRKKYTGKANTNTNSIRKQVFYVRVPRATADDEESSKWIYISEMVQFNGIGGRETDFFFSLLTLLFAIVRNVLCIYKMN